jgi:hypothetical protein
MTEFRPHRGSPLETASDPARLCEICGWFGDWWRCSAGRPRATCCIPCSRRRRPFNCSTIVYRKAPIAEQAYDAGNAAASRIVRRHAARALIEMFVIPQTRVARRPLQRVNGFVPRPEDWSDRHYDGGCEPCDMLVGPCSCGVWRLETEAGICPGWKC